MGALQKLFTAHGTHYLQQFGETMPATHQKVMAAMVACRTPQAGTLLCVFHAIVTGDFTKA